jgi:hypothetical protein
MIEGLHVTLNRVLTSTNPYPPRHPRMRLTKIMPCKEIAEIGGYPESIRLSDIGDRNSKILSFGLQSLGYCLNILKTG